MRRAIGRLLLPLLLGACQTSESAKAPTNCLLVEDGHGPAGRTPIRAETVADGLEVPWAIAFLPDGDLLVTERPGRIRRVRGGELVAEPVAEVPVRAVGEGGLMGIALHPDFSDDRLFYLALTSPDDDNRIELWRLAEDGASAERVRVVFSGIPAHRIHDGGRLRIGPDRKLYLSTGDAGRPDRSQEPDTPSGKILRLELDGSIPADNPDPKSPVFLSGIRNSQGFDWLADGTLVVADHGPSGEFARRGGDEVSLARAGDNLGWPDVWRCQGRKGMVTPSITWRRATPPGGLAVVRGDAIPGWDGSVVVATLGSRALLRLAFDEDGRVREHEVYFPGDPPEGLGRLREAVLGPDGDVYLTTSNCDGRGRCPPEKDKVLRLVPAR